MLSMAVQIINQMPDAVVHRGDPLWSPGISVQAFRPRFFTGRAAFVAATLAVHVLAFAAFIGAQRPHRSWLEPAPIEAALIDAPQSPPEAPPQYEPTLAPVVIAMELPAEVAFEPVDAITPPPAVAEAAPTELPTAMPPLVESIEYLRTAPPVFPKESQRRREYGTVVLLVLVDARGRPTQIDVERSSGFARLDAAARNAVEKFLFRPYEVNGIARPAQVRIPIGFDPPRAT